MTPAFIISFNRWTSLMNLCAELVKRDCEPIIVDTGSTFPAAVTWMHWSGYKVINVDKSYGHTAPWTAGIIDRYKPDYYIVTDPDLDISGVPLNMVDHLKAGFKESLVNKVGLSLEVGDLPDNAYTQEVKNWEAKFWAKRTGTYFQSDIDTTLALYHKRSVGSGKPGFFTALRADRPYTARHLPWYNVPPLSAEDQYLHDNTNHHGYWKTKFKQHFGV